MSRFALLPLMLAVNVAYASDPAPPPPADPAPAGDPAAAAPAPAPVPETEPVAPTADCTKLTVAADKEACLAEWSKYEVAKAAWLAAHPAPEKGGKAKRSNRNRMEAEATDE
jgi:hypothetical protein